MKRLFFVLLVVVIASMAVSATDSRIISGKGSYDENYYVNKNNEQNSLVKKNTEASDLENTDVTSKKISENTVKPYDTSVILYFVDSESNTYEFVKETRKIRVENGEIAKATLNELLKGSKKYGNIIPKGTKLLTIDMKGTTMNVNFSKEFIKNNNLGSGYEVQMIYSIVNTLTEFKSVKQVQFLVEGKIEKVNKHTSMDKPFKRNLKPISTDINAEWGVIESRSKAVLTAMKNKNMDELSSLVHHDKGVRFTPYAYVNLKNDMVFSADKIKTLMSDDKDYTFGVHDGSGKPIKMKFSEYYKEFVYDKDFLNAPNVGHNRIIGRGNTANNVFEAYPGCVVVEYNFAGFESKYEGMDWESLRLVFQKKNSDWYLVGVIHDQWTI